MNKVTRPTIQNRLSRRLALRQVRFDTTQADVNTDWRNFNRTVARIREILNHSARPQNTCMYCNVSETTILDHYKPKSIYTNEVYSFHNFIVCCSGCSQVKGDRFTIDPTTDTPLLINPFDENPWLSLAFDPITGYLIARTSPLTLAYDPKGAYTVNLLQLQNRSKIFNEYHRTALILERTVWHYLDQPYPAHNLKESLLLLDGVGLLNWYVLFEGSNTSPFSDLRSRYPVFWQDLVQEVQLIYQ